MDETALEVFVFNPQNENSFEGVAQWDIDISKAARRPFTKILVAGRCDRGGVIVSNESIIVFQNESNFAEFIETSALTGEGCDRLRDAIINTIDWETIPWVASPRLFKLLKNEIIHLKDEGVALLRMSELKQRLEMRLPNESFTPEVLKAVVGLLAGPGVVWQLDFGDFVLLQPDWINTYAAAVVRSVRAHVGEIGVILENDILSGKLKYTVEQRKDVENEDQYSHSENILTNEFTIRRLPNADEAIVLRAMHQTFVDYGLCLHEKTEAGMQLIFPSYYRRELPHDPGHPPILVTYCFNGSLTEIYATLVVQLYYTKAFENDALWRYAADFRTPSGLRMGLKARTIGEGAAEISVYFEPKIPDDTKVTFIKYVHEHLLEKAQDVQRIRKYVCPFCGTSVENQQVVQKKISQGKKSILCIDCEKRVPLWDLIETKFASDEFQSRVRELEDRAKTAIDNESKELILIGHSFAIAGEAGQIFRQYSNSDHGIDGEIEYKNLDGNASGKRLYLQLKSGDSYLRKRRKDGAEIFSIRKTRWAEYWINQAYPVML